MLNLGWATYSPIGKVVSFQNSMQLTKCNNPFCFLTFRVSKHQRLSFHSARFHQWRGNLHTKIAIRRCCEIKNKHLPWICKEYPFWWRELRQSPERSWQRNLRLSCPAAETRARWAAHSDPVRCRRGKAWSRKRPQTAWSSLSWHLQVWELWRSLRRQCQFLWSGRFPEAALLLKHAEN